MTNIIYNTIDFLWICKYSMWINYMDSYVQIKSYE
jgi:hypothetical protein